MKTVRPDAELAAKIAEGDRQAESELFYRYDSQIKYMAQIRLRTNVPSHDLEDIIAEIRQAVLVSLRKGGYDPEQGKTLGAYIAGIAYKVVCQYFRKQEKEQAVQLGLPEGLPQNSPSSLDDMITGERSRKLRRILGRLHPKYEEVLVLRFYEQLGIAEIAAHLNMDPRRVSERLNYAIKKLTELCKGDEL